MCPEVERAERLVRRRETLAVSAFLAALAAVLTWPQVTVFATQSVEHQDVYFNLWRLRWISHALVTSPLDLFGGNIFYPEVRSLTFSDAILVEGLFAAPFFWLRFPPMLVHNLTLWAALVGSGAGMFVLCRELTGSRAGALIASVVFSFAPYRFDHYMHMELQWALWIPWAFWALHRTITTGSIRHGLLTGFFIALQMLSSIYYGIFLATLLPPAGLVLIATSRRQPIRRVVAALVPGALLAAVICGAYAQPYLATTKELGGRSDQEILRFSARPSSYLIATPDNVVWGTRFEGRSRSERRLFPGAVALLLALTGLLLRPPTSTIVVYLFCAILAFEISLGFSGYTFRFLYDYVPVYQGLRAIARAGLFVLFFVAVLTSFGYAAVAFWLPQRLRRSVAIAFVLLVAAEYRVRPLALVPYLNEPPPLYAWLATQPRGVVAELPMPVPGALPGNDPRYSYLSTFHWFPLLNGYSGFHPPSYVDRVDALRSFPDDASIARLRRDGARYVVVHFDQYPRELRSLVREILVTRYRMPEVAAFPEEGSAVFAME
jgi:hypothetical protein